MSDETTGEAERILALMNELAADVAYARGERRFEGKISAADATFISARLLEAIDDGTEVRARKAREAGLTIACAPGCAFCCEQPILVWLPEALVVAEHLSRPENAEAKEAFLARYPAWRDAVGEGLEQIAAATEAGDWETYGRAYAAARQKRVVCAFNREGLCTVYAARPLACRHHHALETSARCRVDDDSGVPVAYLKFEPLDAFVSRAKLMNSALHHALGERRMRTVALCRAVYELLTAETRVLEGTDGVR
jgi:Fe-S-cluster containining protein